MYCILKTIQYICPTNSRRLHREDAAADSRQADSALRTTTGISYYETPNARHAARQECGADL